MGAGHCEFCGIWHSGSCCHPGRAAYDLLQSENLMLRRKLNPDAIIDDSSEPIEQILAAAKREGAADLVFQLGLATGHADTMEDLVEHVREQLEEMRGNAKREGVEGAIGVVERQLRSTRTQEVQEDMYLGSGTVSVCVRALRALAKEMEG